MILEAIGALATVAGILQTYKASTLAEQDRKQEALSRLSDAVSATTRALNSRRRRNGPNPDLGNAWRQAAIALRGAGEGKLSKLCEVKGVYWMDPSAWTPEEVDAAGIQLDAMDRELHRLLQK